MRISDWSSDVCSSDLSTVTVDGEQYLRVWLGTMASGTQYLTLKGVTAGQLSAANFIFGQAVTQPKVLLSGTGASDLLVGDAGGTTLDGGAGADSSEERRVGKEGVSRCRERGSQ